MQKKFKLDLEDENETIIIGVSSHLKAYRLVWFLNKQLKFKFAKTEDFIYKTNKQKKQLSFSFYYYHDEANMSTYYLLNNISLLENSNLISEYKQADYILLSNFSGQSKNIKTFISEIKKTANVLTAFEISPSEVKYINNVVSDIELHIINIEKKEKEKKKNHTIIENYE